MEWVKDKMGRGFGCYYISFVLQLPPLPTTTSLHHIEKEASTPIPIHQTMLTMVEAGDFEELTGVEDRSDSESCSGCQSGWTHYLEQSHSLLPRIKSSAFEEEDADEEEEGLSMLSDASSGPAHVHNDNEIYCTSCSDGGDAFLHLTQVPEHGSKRRRVEEEQEESSDSTSSTLVSISKAITSGSKKLLLMEDEHISFSSTHFTGETSLEKDLAHLHSSPLMACRQEVGMKKLL